MPGSAVFPDYFIQTFDTDVAVKANTRTETAEDLMRAISEIRMGAVDIASLRTLAMNPCSILAATYSVSNLGIIAVYILIVSQSQS